MDAMNVLSLLGKLGDPDPDFRFMSLNDLVQLLNSNRNVLESNFNAAARCVDSIVAAIDDTNGEVQNLAIKCLAPLSKRLPGNMIPALLDRLCRMDTKNSVDPTIPALALRTVVTSLPRQIPGRPRRDVVDAAFNAIVMVLLPRLLGPAARVAVPSHSVQLPPTPPGILENAKTVIPEFIEVLVEVVRCFGPLLTEKHIACMQKCVAKLLGNANSQPSVKRRAVGAISVLSNHISDALLADTVDDVTEILSNPATSPATRRNYITVLGSMARSIPDRFVKYLPTVSPYLFRALGPEELQQLREQVNDGGGNLHEFNEVREAALVTLETFFSSCPDAMSRYAEDAVGAALRYIKYDPNMTGDAAAAADDDDDNADDDDMELNEGGDEDDDSDFDDDEPDFGDDDDDTSWKVRRCAAKVLNTIVSVNVTGHRPQDAVIFRMAAPPLVRCLEEREENVRLEIIATFSLLVQKASGRSSTSPRPDPLRDDLLETDLVLQSTPPVTRKRRRQSSSGGGGGGGGGAYAAAVVGLGSPVAEKVPETGPRAELARLAPLVIRRCVKLLVGKFLPTKQAVVHLLDEMVCAQHGVMADSFARSMGAVIDAMRQSSSGVVSGTLAAAGGNASATPTTLRMAALRLAGHVVQTHSSTVLQSHLPAMVDATIVAAKDRFYKVSSEALRTATELIRAITPPRSRAVGHKFRAELFRIHDTIMERSAASDADLEVRNRSIHALAVLLARTANAADGFPQDRRDAALAALLDRLRNETTRLAAVRAIDGITSSRTGLQLDPDWTRRAALSLTDQLRKNDRALRVASVQALRHLVTFPGAQGRLDDATLKSMADSVIPGIRGGEPHLLGPSLLVLATLVVQKPDLAADESVTRSLCELLRSHHADIVLDQILTLATNVGRAGSGGSLMAVLLREVSIAGEPDVVGKVIGALLVASGASAGVTIDNFVAELGSSAKRGDDRRVSLALVVLGEVGMRLGAGSPLEPELFLDQFHPEPDKVSLAAATALGRAGSGDVPRFLPVILRDMDRGGNTQYLLILALKEILHQVTELSASAHNPHIREHAAAIWDHLLQACANMDNKVVCAECVGRLAILEPNVFMPRLQMLLQDQSSTLRGMAIQAIRYSLPESDETFDATLKNVLVDMLLAIMKDKDMDIRRLAMTALNSAAHNKPDLILPDLGRLMPLVMAETVKNPSLVREVKLGPFTHFVDDGLDLRKSAYDTLYALMETAFSRISMKEFYDRIVAGLQDDNEIRSLCNLMLSKLVVLRPDETASRLDDISNCYRAILTTKLKENAVKQDVEKQEEAVKGVLRLSLLLEDRLKCAVTGTTLSGSEATVSAVRPPAYPLWATYWEWIQITFDKQMKSLREESLQLQTTTM